MASVLYGTGQRLNLLERSTVTVTLGAADSLFGAENLYDGRPSKPFRFSTKLAEESITLDTNAVLNPGLESWSSGPTSWTATAGVVIEETIFHSGVAAAKLDGTTGGGTVQTMYQDIVARAGETRHIKCWLRGGGGGGQEVLVYVQNLTTGRYLDTNGAWTPTLTNTFTRTTASYGESTRTYVVESYTRCDEDLVTLRITVGVNAGYVGYADDITDCPGSNLLALFGMAVEDRCTVAWTTSDDNSSYGDSASAGSSADGWGADQRPNIYIKRASVTAKRYQRVTFLSVSATTLSREVGEMVMCEVATAARNHDWGYELKAMRDRIRGDSIDGSPSVYTMSRWPRRAFAAVRQFVSDAQMHDARDPLWRRAKGDALNVLLVPDDTANLVLLGRLDESFTTRRLFTSWYGDNSLVLAELPFVSVAL